ncbi:FecR family protein [Sphingomonas bacterium]|uniref:FecR family protein n=1 Tax=Sphingomonas bacterium TaxID=1895847 RepID=UPI0015757D3E|nr:FecR domain-containing protein [Sphingomonas bacterium]
MSAPAPHLSDDTREAAAAWCVRLSDGPLGEHDRQAFQEWLDGSPEHPALFERTVVAWTAIEDQAAEPELLRWRGEALEGVHKAGRRRWSRPTVAWRQAFAIAACLALLIGTGSWWHYAPTTYRTEIGERRVVALADGSTISLDAATQVDVRYLGDRRKLWLDYGRAKFSVAKDPLRPFSVQAGRRMVIATGTQFSVEKLSDEVRVVLYEGHVAVLDTSRPRPQPLAIGPGHLPAERVLVPGLELIMPSASSARPISDPQSIKADALPVARVVPVDPGRTLGWEAGILEFSDEPLGDAVERMNRYGPRTLRVADASARAITISGQFDGGNPDAFVEGVTSVFPVKASRAANGDITLRGTNR